MYVELEPCNSLIFLADTFDEITGFKDDLGNANGFRVSILRRHELTKKIEEKKKKRVIGRQMEITPTEVEVNVSSIVLLSVMCISQTSINLKEV